MDLSEKEAVFILKVIADLSGIVEKTCPDKYSKSEEMLRAVALFKHLEDKFDLGVEQTSEKQFWFQPEQNKKQTYDKGENDIIPSR